MTVILNCFINLSFSLNLTFLIVLQVIRSGQKVQSKKATGGQKHGGGFFSSFFGRKSKKDEPEQEESKDKESN